MLYLTMAREIAVQHIAELHQQAARQHMLRRLRAVTAVSPAKSRVRAGWVRLGLRRSRPVTGTTRSGYGRQVLR